MELQVLSSPFWIAAYCYCYMMLKLSLIFFFCLTTMLASSDILHQGFGSFLSATAPLWWNKRNLLNKSDVFVLPSRQKWLSRTSTITVGLRLPPSTSQRAPRRISIGTLPSPEPLPSGAHMHTHVWERRTQRPSGQLDVQNDSWWLSGQGLKQYINLLNGQSDVSPLRMTFNTHTRTMHRLSWKCASMWYSLQEECICCLP